MVISMAGLPSFQVMTISLVAVDVTAQHPFINILYVSGSRQCRPLPDNDY